jgi:hypothetical protein
MDLNNFEFKITIEDGVEDPKQKAELEKLITSEFNKLYIIMEDELLNKENSIEESKDQSYF